MLKAVPYSEDFKRIEALPTRQWKADPGLEFFRDAITQLYRHNDTPCPKPCQGCKAKRINEPQAAGFKEAHDLPYGAFLPFRPGAGKTLEGFLLPAILEAKNPLLVVPGGLEAKTRKEYIEYSRHWMLPAVTIVTIEFLSHPKNLHWLEGFRPDCVIVDEAHNLRNDRCKAWRRLDRYFKSYPTTKRVFMTGSAGGRKINEYGHYLQSCLGLGAPVPRTKIELEIWGRAVNEKVPLDFRLPPGALDRLPGHEDEKDDLRRARLKYRDRLNATPGVVSTLEDVPACGLRVWVKELPMPPEVSAMFRAMRKDYVTPGGDSFKLAIELWNHCRTLGCGVYSAWRPPPPNEWRLRRYEWHSFAREWLANRRILDSEVHLIEEIKKGNVDDGGLLQNWRAIEPIYDASAHVQTVWVHDNVVRYADAWLKEEKGLVWVPHRAVGERIADVASVPYFRDGGMDNAGRLVDDYAGPCVVSVDSCSEGHNLQAHHKNLILSTPSTGAGVEQLLARTHRDGQEEHEVTAEFVVTCQETYMALAQALRDARFAEETSGQPQRLCYATRDLGPVEEMALDDTYESWREYGI